jgi:predicted transcriptional regulator
MERAEWVPMPAADVTAAPRSRFADMLAALRRDPRQAVEEERIVCLICAASFRQLTNTHLRAHQLTAAEYKTRFGYNRGRPLMCRTLARLYAERAVRNGLADRIRIRPIVAEPALRRRGGMRPVTLEELLTRRDARRATGGGGP